MWLIMGGLLFAIPIAAGSYYAFIISPVGAIAIVRTVWYLWLLAKEVTIDEAGIVARTYLGRRVSIPWLEVAELETYGDGQSFTDIRRLVRVRGRARSLLFTNRLSRFDALMEEFDRRLPNVPRRRPGLIARLLFTS
jgi:hypothetical protein